jgi:hypothetical protein
MLELTYQVGEVKVKLDVSEKTTEQINRMLWVLLHDLQIKKVGLEMK